MKTEIYLTFILIFIAILTNLWPILQTVRLGFWKQNAIDEKKAGTPTPLKPKTPNDLALCREIKESSPKEAQTHLRPCP
jgi:hypothetical protein